MPCVSLLQTALNVALAPTGYPAIAVDGYFGAGTERAVERYSYACGLIDPNYEETIAGQLVLGTLPNPIEQCPDWDPARVPPHDF